MDTTITHKEISTEKKIGSLNLIRFFAASFVLMYHFTFIFYYAKTTFVDIPLFRYIFQYGYLGVELFFMISGFVISLSAEGRNAFGFLKSRMGRLYPLFWTSAIITGIFLFTGGNLINAPLSIPKFLINLTMVAQLIPARFGFTLLDPSYWTLAIELKFYLLIYTLLMLDQFKRLELATYIMSTGIIIGIVFLNMPTMWTSYFLAGVFFYKIYKEGLTNGRIIGVCMTFFISLYFALARIPSLEENFIGTTFKPIVIASFILAYFIIFLLVSLNKFTVPNNKYINLLGILTYPVYLLHQQIARVLFSYAHIQNVPLYVSFPLILAFVYGLGYTIHKLFEQRGRKLVGKALDRFTPDFIKHI